MAKMSSDKLAHAKLVKIQKENSSYRNVKRERNDRNDALNGLLTQVEKMRAVPVKI